MLMSSVRVIYLLSGLLDVLNAVSSRPRSHPIKLLDSEMFFPVLELWIHVNF